MLDEVARWDDLVTGLRPMTCGTKGEPACCLVSARSDDYGEGIERRVASSPSPQQEAFLFSRFKAYFLPLWKLMDMSESLYQWEIYE